LQLKHLHFTENGVVPEGDSADDDDDDDDDDGDDDDDDDDASGLMSTFANRVIFDADPNVVVTDVDEAAEDVAEIWTKGMGSLDISTTCSVIPIRKVCTVVTFKRIKYELEDSRMLLGTLSTLEFCVLTQAASGILIGPKS